MKHRYAKTGQTVRLERRQASRTLIRSFESGIAHEEDDVWHARTWEVEGEPDLDLEDVLDIEKEIDSQLSEGVVISRMTVACGLSEHEIDDDPETRRWSDRWVRVHAEIDAPATSLRAWVDLGGDSSDSLGHEAIGEISSNLADVVLTRETITGPLRLAPPVAALLWSTLVWETDCRSWLSRCSNSALRIVQREGQVPDGDGQPVLGHVILDCENEATTLWEELPNLFRPSYKLRPIRAPFHTSACEAGNPVSIDIAAIAVLGPIQVDRDEIQMPVLCKRAGLPPVAGILKIRPEEIASKLLHVETDERWFPHAAGAWGGWTSLDDVLIVPSGHGR